MCNLSFQVDSSVHDPNSQEDSKNRCDFSDGGTNKTPGNLDIS